MKAVVIEDGRYDDGALVENPEFMRYAYHWNFRIRACRPYRAQTKGKVERPIRYLRESFFYGRTFTSDDDLDAQALHWLETEANVRSHATLKERPLDRFERERLLLEPLATRPYHPLVLPPDRSSPKPRQGTTSLPAIHVERRPLTAYAQIAGAQPVRLLRQYRRDCVAMPSGAGVHSVRLPMQLYQVPISRVSTTDSGILH